MPSWEPEFEEIPIGLQEEFGEDDLTEADLREREMVREEIREEVERDFLDSWF